METFEIKKCYRWNVGPETGVIEAYLAEDEERIWFESGNSVPKSEIEQKLSSVSEQEYTSYINNQTAKIDQFSQWENMLGNPTPNSISPPNPSNGISHQQSLPKLVEEKSPIRIILEKQKKKSVKDISIPFEFNFPSEKAIEFMMMMFDEDEVIEEIVEFALSQMSIEEINEIIKENIKESIKNLLPDVESE
jgi:hypothetical protein